MRSKRISKLIAAGLLAAWAIPFSRPSHAQDADEYRQVLLELVDVLELTFGLTNFSDHQATLDQARTQFSTLTDEQIDSVLTTAVPLTQLHELLDQARSDLSLAQRQIQAAEKLNAATSQAAGVRSIEIPVVDVNPGFCVNTTGPLSFAALITARSVKPLLRAAEFPCQQVIAGENSALACATLEVLSTTAEIEYELTQFCLNEKRAGKGKAILQFERNIGHHLNTFVDATSSSRASQASVDQLQLDVTTAQSDIGITQQSLDDGFIQISTQLRNTLNGLNQLDQNLLAVSALAQDIQFRTQATQVDIEDVQQRSADLQQSSSELRNDTENLISSAGLLQTHLSNLINRYNTAQRQVENDSIAAALASADTELVEHTLPAAVGGQLERVREVVTQSIIAVSQAGAGDSSNALALLNQGDQAYNQKNYLSAYRFFAQAYRSLAQAATAGRR